MLQRLADRLASAGVPNASGLILRCGDDSLALGVKSAGPNSGCVLQWFADRLAGAAVPDAGGLIGRSRDYALTFWIEGRGKNRIIMPHRGDQEPVCRIRTNQIDEELRLIEVTAVVERQNHAAQG